MQRLAATLALALILPSARGDEKADEAAKKLNGTYEVVSVIADGKADDKKKDEVKSVVIKDGEIISSIQEREEKVKFKLDPSKKPAHIDILSPKDEKVTALGLYETKETDKGLELTLAFGRRGRPGDKAEDRPKDFKGENVTVLKLLRKKDK